MKAPVSWITEYVDLPAEVSTEALTDRLTALGLKLEGITSAAEGITGPLVIGRVLTMQPEQQKNGKTINWCSVDVGAANGTGEPQGIVCGAHNFAPGDLVVVILPGGVLPGDVEISARKTYGHLSAGMICSARELGIGEDHDGIIVLPSDAGEPGESAFDVLGLGEEVIEFEINPDRAYALSLRGVAREAAMGFDAPFTDPADRDLPEVDQAAWPVEVADPAGCPVFAARLVSGLDPEAATPAWMRTRLEQCGVRAISLPVDVTNYVMLELGQPIHGYDADKVAGALRVRRAQAGEKLRTLDDMVRELSPEDLVIVDDSGPIGLAGVMGGATTELSQTSTRVLVEAAHWDAVSTFRTGRRHKLTSEAGRRNERGVDPLLPGAAADRVVQLLVELGGATAEPGFTLVGTAPRPDTITMAPELPARISGLAISADDTVAHLGAIGAEVAEGADGTLSVTPPTWRPDLTDPYDLVEEVARIVGYEDIPSVLPRRAVGGGLTRTQTLRRRIGRTLAGAGLVEVISFPWVGEQTFDDLGLTADDERRETVLLANPMNSEEPGYTTTVLPGLLKAAARNLGRGQDGVALFETQTVAVPSAARAPILGVAARPSEDELARLMAAIPHQPLHLGVVLTGERERPGWWGPGRAATWADAIEVVRRLGAELGLVVTTVAASRAPWHPGRCAEVSVAGESIGYAGELHPAVCRAFGLAERTAAVEIDLDALMARVPFVAPGPVFSTMPVAKEDVALLVDDSVSVAEVQQALVEGAGELLESVRLFDVYTGEQLGAGKKSLAFALRFRAPDRTLRAEEANAARDAAVARAIELTGAVQR
ncbi:MAG: phenylalanine--tRNA ligase subunit beta [Nocardioides sp.]|uniref:phenylalanine--tRNA ligase subunit beta n=1 Tax=Nocardioides sp. TaxID=35761 RepID=UPI0039E3968A